MNWVVFIVPLLAACTSLRPVDQKHIDEHQRTPKPRVGIEIEGNAKGKEEDIESRLKQLEDKQLDAERKPWWSTGIGWVTSVDADSDGNEYASIMLNLLAFPWRTMETDNPRFLEKLFFSAGVGVGRVGGSEKVDGPLYAFGTGYKVIPELGFLVGFSFFEETESNSKKDIESAFFYGVTIDVSLFSSLFK